MGSSSLASREALACLGWEDLSGSPLSPWYSDNLPPFAVTCSLEIFGEQVCWRPAPLQGKQKGNPYKHNGLRWRPKAAATDPSLQKRDGAFFQGTDGARADFFGRSSSGDRHEQPELAIELDERRHAVLVHFLPQFH